MESDIYFRQFNLNGRIAATAEIESRVNQIHLLQEPYINEKGDFGVDIKSKCFGIKDARAVIYAPDIRDVTILPVWDLMAKDMAVVLLESKAERKPL